MPACPQARSQYLNAHATSTPLGDRGRGRSAIERVFGSARARRSPSARPKSMTGHLLGGAGARRGGLISARPPRSGGAARPSTSMQSDADDVPRSRSPHRAATDADDARDDELVRLRRDERQPDLPPPFTLNHAAGSGNITTKARSTRRRTKKDLRVRNPRHPRALLRGSGRPVDSASPISITRRRERAAWE